MYKKLMEIPLREIEITDGFWKKYIKLVGEVIIPYQWNILNDLVPGAEPSHCIHNFLVAAGDRPGEFEGAVFQDTDVAKWLEAVSYYLEHGPDPELEALADETIELIGRVQREDGYLNTYFIIKEPGQRFLNLQEGHELYTAGHMIEAAVAYHKATGKKALLEIVCRMADLFCETFGPGEEQCHGYPGHQEIELALIKLYRVTGRRKYLELAKYFIDARGQGDNYFLEEERLGKKKRIFPEFAEYDPRYSQSHIPVREQKTAEGHAVRAVYMYCAMADLAFEYQDEALLTACITLWKNMVEKRMYVTGGIGSSGILERFTTDYDLPNDRGYAETCASIGMALFGKRMAQITRDASYMDIVELELYNNILSGIALDGTSFFYVNPLEVRPENCMERTSMEHVKPVRQKWFGVACCPPNIARTLASLGQYLYFQEEDTLYVNLYISGTVRASTRTGAAELSVESQMPWNGFCEIKVNSKSEEAFYLALRVPDYAKNFCVRKNGNEMAEVKVLGGYAMPGGLASGDILTVTWEMKACFLHANPWVGADAGKTAIKKGPVVYCLEQVDNGENLAGIFVDSSQTLTEQYEPDLLGGVVTISLTGKRLKKETWPQERLYDDRIPEFEPVSLKTVPYSAWNNREPGEMAVWMKELYHV